MEVLRLGNGSLRVTLTESEAAELHSAYGDPWLRILAWAEDRMSNTIIFEQDGVVYCALSHELPARMLASETAAKIRTMHRYPRARMRVVSDEEVRAMKFGRPKRE